MEPLDREMALASHWVVRAWLKFLLMWGLVVVSCFGTILLGLWVFLQFDISKGWFMALMFILWVGPTLIILHFMGDGGDD